MESFDEDTHKIYYNICKWYQIRCIFKVIGKFLQERKLMVDLGKQFPNKVCAVYIFLPEQHLVFTECSSFISKTSTFIFFCFFEKADFLFAESIQFRKEKRKLN